MRVTAKKMPGTETQKERCDIKVWSGACASVDSRSGENDYFCALCGTIRGLDHEVHHELFPHVSGDTESLS